MKLNTREVSILLAALRLYQQVYNDCGGDLPDEYADIASNGGEIEPLELEEIDELCERINTIES